MLDSTIQMFIRFIGVRGFRQGYALLMIHLECFQSLVYNLFEGSNDILHEGGPFLASHSALRSHWSSWLSGRDIKFVLLFLSYSLNLTAGRPLFLLGSLSASALGLAVTPAAVPGFPASSFLVNSAL